MTKHKQISATASWESPSNLAIVKYWGKHGLQEPLNPSISFSLAAAVTRTRVSTRPSDQPGFSFRLNGAEKAGFNEKIATFLERVHSHLPFLQHHFLQIDSCNTFPHSSGIASSASSMSALALCLTQLHLLHSDKEETAMDSVLASTLARMGSGSAARSVYGGWTLWGRYPGKKESSDMYALPLEEAEIDPDFRSLHNSILLIDPGQKAVSSTAGHALMNHHPYREARVEQAQKNTERLLAILKAGEWDDFFELAENEALSLHGLMMSSTPSYTLLHPNSLEAIHRIRRARREHGLPIGFSMDAGPNIHLLYPAHENKKIRTWMQEELQPLCADKAILHDQVGTGPRALTSNQALDE